MIRGGWLLRERTKFAASLSLPPCSINEDSPFVFHGKEIDFGFVKVLVKTQKRNDIERIEFVQNEQILKIIRRGKILLIFAF